MAHDTEASADADKQEADRLVALGDQWRQLCEFVEWLHDSGYAICTHGEPPTRDAAWLALVHGPQRLAEELVARYFGIDMQAVERHRRRLLEGLSAAHERATGQPGTRSLR